MKTNVSSYYSNDYDESNRHQDPFGRIQEIRTRQLLLRYLGDRKSILDVGGATGVYAFFLADHGFDVSLIDIAENHTRQARQINAGRSHKLTDIIHADIQEIELANKYDAIILHGPLYHIVDRPKRIKLLKKLSSILTPNGLILGFCINRYAGYFYGVRSGKILDRAYQKSVLNEIKTGVRHMAPGWYFHTPAEIVAEYEEASLSVVAIKGVTSQIWMLPEVDQILSTNEGLEKIISLAEQLEDSVDIGQDILCVGQIKE